MWSPWARPVNCFGLVHAVQVGALSSWQTAYGFAPVVNGAAKFGVVSVGHAPRLGRSGATWS